MQYARDACRAMCHRRVILPVCIPVISYGLAWFCMSCLLHLATMEFIRLNAGIPGRSLPLDDIGLNLLGQRDVPVKVLDMIAAVGMGGFILGSIMLRDIRLWVKVWYTGCLLFLLKGISDWASIMPDSAGYGRCAARLTPDGVNYFTNMSNLLYGGQPGGFGDFLKSWIKLEFGGIIASNGSRIYPVRYCSDMAISGHTFNLVTFFLGFVECIIKKAQKLWGHEEPPVKVQIASILAYVVMVAAMVTEAYLILVEHFHYTSDILQGIVFAFLVYTNPAMTMWSKWLVDHLKFHRTPEDHDHNGVTWIPALLLPCCCFHGFYEITEELHIDEHFPPQERLIQDSWRDEDDDMENAKHSSMSMSSDEQSDEFE